MKKKQGISIKAYVLQGKQYPKTMEDMTMDNQNLLFLARIIEKRLIEVTKAKEMVKDCNNKFCDCGNVYWHFVDQESAFNDIFVEIKSFESIASFKEYCFAEAKMWRNSHVLLKRTTESYALAYDWVVEQIGKL